MELGVIECLIYICYMEWARGPILNIRKPYGFGKAVWLKFGWTIPLRFNK